MDDEESANRNGDPKPAGLARHLVLGFRAGALAGVIIGLGMIVLLVAKAPYYFTTLHRIVVLPVYVTAYGSLLFALVCSVVAVLIWLSGRLFRPLARVEARRLYRAVAVALVPGWIVGQYVTWVAFRGRADTWVVLSNGAVIAGMLVTAVLVYFLWTGAQAARSKARLRGWIGWSVYGLAVVVSFVLVWGRAPRAEMPVGDASAAVVAGEVVRASSAPASAPGSAASRRSMLARHVLLITVDSLRADRLGCYGYDLNTSPVLDALAAKSIRFHNTYSHASGTLPSFMSIFSGTDPVYVGGISQLSSFSGDIETLTELLQAAGFKTAASVRHDGLCRGNGFAQGFDQYTNLRGDDPELVTDDVVKTLTELRGQDRIFLWAHYYNVHVPYNPPAELVDLFKRPPGTDPRVRPAYRYSALYGINLGHLGKYRTHAKDGRVSAAFVDALYDAEVRDADNAIGRLLGRIRELGLWEDTAVFVSSDHGEAMGEHGYYCQHCPGVYGSQIRIPLILSWPKMPRIPGGVDSLVVTSDIAPTILELVGLPVPAAMTGRSLVPFLTADAAGWSSRQFIAQTTFGTGMTNLLNSLRFNYPDWALIDGGYEYIYFANSVFDEIRWPLNYLNAWRELVRGHVCADELYHLGDDPASTKNIVRQRPDVARRMRRRLLSSPQIRFFRENIRPAEQGVDEEHIERLRGLGYL